MNSIKVCFTGAVRLAPDAFLPQLCDQEVTVNRQPGLHTAAGGADSCTHCLLWFNFLLYICLINELYSGFFCNLNCT